MKGLISLFAGLVLFVQGFSQSFAVTTTYVNFTGSAQSSEVPSPPNFPAISNVSGDTINMRWVRVEENIPSWWRSSICRASYCYSIPDDSGSFTMLPGGVDMLYIHIYPYGFSDTGNVVVKLFNVDSPSDSERIMFHADLSTGIDEHSTMTFFHIDPANHQIRFSPIENGHWTLTDVTGRTIAGESTKPGEIYTAKVATSGIYFFTFVNAVGVVEVRKLIL